MILHVMWNDTSFILYILLFGSFRLQRKSNHLVGTHEFYPMQGSSARVQEALNDEERGIGWDTVRLCSVTLFLA